MTKTRQEKNAEITALRKEMTVSLLTCAAACQMSMGSNGAWASEIGCCWGCGCGGFAMVSRQAVDCAALIGWQAELENNTKLNDEYEAMKDLARAALHNATKFNEDISAAHALMYALFW